MCGFFFSFARVWIAEPRQQKLQLQSYSSSLSIHSRFSCVSVFICVQCERHSWFSLSIRNQKFILFSFGYVNCLPCIGGAWEKNYFLRTGPILLATLFFLESSWMAFILCSFPEMMRGVANFV